MKTTLFYLFNAAVFIGLSASAAPADTNPPPRLTVELRDGSRVVGDSVEKNLKFHSALLGGLKLNVKDIRAVECVATNSVKLTAANGDTLMVSFVEASFAIKTSFGKVELAVDSVRRILAAVAGHPQLARPGLLAFLSGDGNADDSTGQHNGILMGRAGFAPGPLGQAFNLTEPGSFIKIQNPDGLNPDKQLTIEFWMNADEANDMDNFQGLVTSDFYGVEISNGFGGGKMGVNCYVTTAANETGPRFGFDQRLSGFRSRVTSDAIFSDANGGAAIITAGQWHHVAATYDGAHLRLFIDGHAVGNPVAHAGSISLMRPGSFVAIGSEDGRTNYPNCPGQRYFKGLIRDVAIYSRALSVVEIREDYEAGNSN